MSSASNQELLDFIEEENNVLNKQVREQLLSAEEFMNVVKRDFRSLNIDYLVIDVQAFDKYQDTFLGIETFQLLNPKSKVVLMFPDNMAQCELSPEIEQYPIFTCKSIGNELMELMNGKVIEEVSDENSEIFEENKEEELEQIQIVIPEETLKEDVTVEISEQEHPIMALNADTSIDIFEKANQRIKTHDGLPIAERKRDDIEKKEPKIVMLEEYVKIDKWNCSNVVIAFVGVGIRVGTTTAAFHLCHYLSSECGALLSYSETDAHGHLDCIAEEYLMEQIEGGYKKDSTAFYVKSAFDTNAGLNFIILDLGSYQERPGWMKEIIRNLVDEVIVVTGARKYELQAFEHCVEQISNLGKAIQVVANFTTEIEMKSFKEQYGNGSMLVHQGEYEPVLFMSTKTDEEITRLLQRYNE